MFDSLKPDLHHNRENKLQHQLTGKLKGKLPNNLATNLTGLMGLTGKLNPMNKPTTLLQPYYPELQYIDSYDGFKIPVTVIGPKQGDDQGQPVMPVTPVLLLHAFGMDARQFLPFILPLVSQYRFYLPHFRGFGLAANTPSSEFNFIEQYADDVEVLLSHICDKHQTEAVDVAAISMGALVVWAHFNRYCDTSDSRDALKPAHSKTAHSKIARYLNIDQSPIVHNQPDWQGGVFGDKQAEIFEQFSEVLQAALPYLDALNVSEFSHLPYPLKRRITQMETAFSLMSVDRLPSRLLITGTGHFPSHKLALYQHPTWQQKLRGLQAYLELPYDYRNALPNNETPITLLIGGQSKLYDPVWQRKLATILPNANVIEVPESGHAIPMDAPIRFASLLKQFLQA